MVKSYLRYLHETTFGTINSPICKSIESLSPELVFSGTDDFVTLWNCKLNDIKIKFEFKKDEYNPSSLVVCFILTNNLNKNDLNDKYLFVGYKDGIIRRFLLDNHLLSNINTNNPSNNNEVLVINEDNVLIAHKSSITCLSLSVNEELLISGGNDGNVLVWNVFDCQLLYKLKGHKNIILSTIYYFNNRLIVNDSAKSKHISDSTTKKLKHGSFGHNSSNRSKLLENKDELGYVFSMSKDNMIKVWDIVNETCINTIIEPLLQFNYFTITSDKLYVNYRNNNVVHCYKINDLNDVKLLYKIENQHNYLKSKHLQLVSFANHDSAIQLGDTSYADASGANVSTSDDDFDSNSQRNDNGRTDLLFVTYNKHIYIYKILNESETESRRLKRMRRINEKLKVKINKLKKILKMTNRPVDKARLSADLKLQYKYLKSLLTNESIDTSDATDATTVAVTGSANNENDGNISDIEDANQHIGDRDDEHMDIDEDKYADGDFYKLLHIYNINDHLNSASDTSTTNANNASEQAADAENAINSVHIYNYYAVINYTNNITNVFKLNKTALFNKLVSDSKASNQPDSDDDGRADSPFDRLYGLNKYHNNSIKLIKLSLDNRKLLTLSHSKMMIFNTHNNRMINYTNSHFQYSSIDSLNDTESLASAESEREYVHNITNVLFLNNSNVLLVLRSNRLLLYNLNTHSFYSISSLNEIIAGHFEGEHHLGGTKNEIIDVHYKNEDDQELLLLVFKFNWVKKVNLSTGGVSSELNTANQITHSQVDHKHVYLGLLNNNILIVYYNSLKIYLTLFGHSLPLTSLATSSDLILLASSSMDKTIKIWDVKFGNIIKSLLQHSKTVTQIKFLNNTHYLISISHDNKIKLYDCDEFVLITEISSFNYPLSSIEMSNYNQFFYTTGSNCYCISKYHISNDLIFVEEEHEKLQDRQISKELNLNNKILNTLEQLIEALEIEDEEMQNEKLKSINHILNNINYNLVYNMLLSLPFINIEQLVQSIINIFEIYFKDENGKNKRNLVNLESLIYISLMISEIYLKQFVTNKTNIYKLKKHISRIISNYLEIIYFNKSGLEYIKNAIESSNNSLKRLI